MMVPALEVLTLGECMGVCYPPDPVPIEEAASLTVDIAGTEANTAIGLQRLGHGTRFISRVGDDPFGRKVRAVLDAEGVDTACLRVDPTAPTGAFFREWLPDGSRRVYYYRSGSAASGLSPDDIRPGDFGEARVVHLTGITPALSTSCAAAVRRAMEVARGKGAAIAFDPNYRPQLWDREVARRALLPIMRDVDILLMGHEDAEALLEATDPRSALEAGADLGPTTVVIKRAEHGASAQVGGVRFDVPAARVTRAVDPVGAGDGFNAGFLAGWLRGYDTKESLELGATVGAAAAGSLGDYAGYPRLSEGRTGHPDHDPN